MQIASTRWPIANQCTHTFMHHKPCKWNKKNMIAPQSAMRTQSKRCLDFVANRNSLACKSKIGKTPSNLLLTPRSLYCNLQQFSDSQASFEESEIPAPIQLTTFLLSFQRLWHKHSHCLSTRTSFPNFQQKKRRDLPIILIFEIKRYSSDSSRGMRILKETY